jgi:hypothetical protein
MPPRTIRTAETPHKYPTAHNPRGWDPPLKGRDVSGNRPILAYFAGVGGGHVSDTIVTDVTFSRFAGVALIGRPLTMTA